MISTLNIATITDTFELIRETQHTLGPIGGIFHLAMVLRDTLIENQTVDNFKASAEMKYWGEMTCAEIGQRIDMQENAVRIRLYRAIQKLKQMCGVTGEGQP